MPERKLLRRSEAIIIVFLAAALTVLYVLAPTFSAEGVYAVITCDGETVDSISLDSEGNYTYPALPGMVFTVSDGSVAVTESGCPDRICVRSGRISHRGEALICVPNRVTVSIGGGSGDVDVII